MNSRTAWVLGLAALCSAANLAATPAAMAGEVGTAATCTHPSWSNKDSNVGRTRESKGSWIPVKTGPNDGCAVEVNVSYLNVLNYDCFVTNSAGNTWTHLVTPSGRRGWVYDGNLDDGGSFVRC